MVIEIICHPEEKVSRETRDKIFNIVKERSKKISLEVKVPISDIEVHVYSDIHGAANRANLTSDNKLGIFVGYVDYESAIHITQPETLEPIFGDNLWKQFYILIDSVLYKFYLCQKFFPEDVPYKLYYKYLTEALSRILSGNVNKDYLLYEIKKYDKFSRLKKELEVEMIFLIILEKAGRDFIIENLKIFYEDCNIKKSILKIFKKEYSEIVEFYKLELKEKEKELKKV